MTTMTTMTDFGWMARRGHRVIIPFRVPGGVGGRAVRWRARNLHLHHSMHLHHPVEPGRRRLRKRAARQAQLAAGGAGGGGRGQAGRAACHVCVCGFGFGCFVGVGLGVSLGRPGARATAARRPAEAQAQVPSGFPHVRCNAMQQGAWPAGCDDAWLRA